MTSSILSTNQIFSLLLETVLENVTLEHSKREILRKYRRGVQRNDLNTEEVGHFTPFLLSHG